MIGPLYDTTQHDFAPGCRLAVIIPALNEERTIGDVIDRIPDLIGLIDTVHVIVVDDGSSDATAEIAASC